MGALKFFLLFAVIVEFVCCDSLRKCFETDSISCLQMQTFRTIRNIFEKPSIELFAGITLDAKPVDKDATGGREIVLEDVSEKIEESDNFEKRQSLIEDYIMGGIQNMWSERSLNWNTTLFVKSITNNIPKSTMRTFSDFIVEGRGKAKKQLRTLMPLLIALKMKVIALVTLLYLGIAAIAKKALVAGVISLVVSAYLGLKNLMANKHNHQYEVGYETVVSPSYHGYSMGGYEPEWVGYAGRKHLTFA